MLTGQELIDTLKTQFDHQIVLAEEKVPGQVFLKVVPDALVPVVHFLNEIQPARFLINAGTDRVRQDGKYLLSYIFSFDREKLFLCLQVGVEAATPEI